MTDQKDTVAEENTTPADETKQPTPAEDTAAEQPSASAEATADKAENEAKPADPAADEAVAEATDTADAPADEPSPAEAADESTSDEAEATAEAEQTEQAGPRFADIKPGMTVRVHQRIRETNAKGEEKERIQIFEGMVLARKHGKTDGATVTVRKISGGIGVEKIFPLNSPNVVNIEPVKQAKVRRAKLYFLRNWKKKLKETVLNK